MRWARRSGRRRPLPLRFAVGALCALSASECSASNCSRRMLRVAPRADARKLQEVCKALLLGADAPEEDEFASMSLEAADIPQGIARYKKELCYGYGQPCHSG